VNGAALAQLAKLNDQELQGFLDTTGIDMAASNPAVAE
jgi:hypothetical protein